MGGGRGGSAKGKESACWSRGAVFAVRSASPAVCDVAGGRAFAELAAGLSERQQRALGKTIQSKATREQFCSRGRGRTQNGRTRSPFL